MECSDSLRVQQKCWTLPFFKNIYKDGEPIGWEICPITEEEQTIAGTMRDLQFFGIRNTDIKYDGLKLINPEKGKKHGNIKSLRWVQERHLTN
ncbi:MAG: hypothetical protein ACOH2V_00440 [Candidatus Saccharimonadaceae bacterium]